MRGLGSGHVTCGPMRGLEINFTETDVRTDGRTSRLSVKRSEMVDIWSLTVICSVGRYEQVGNKIESGLFLGS